jgi:hypothetical protein
VEMQFCATAEPSLCLRYQDSIRKMMDHPQPISINIGSLTYENEYGTFKLKEKNWVEELNHRTLVTEYGITTILRY